MTCCDVNVAINSTRCDCRRPHRQGTGPVGARRRRRLPQTGRPPRRPLRPPRGPRLAARQPGAAVAMETARAQYAAAAGGGDMRAAVRRTGGRGTRRPAARAAATERPRSAARRLRRQPVGALDGVKQRYDSRVGRDGRE